MSKDIFLAKLTCNAANSDSISSMTHPDDIYEEDCLSLYAGNTFRLDHDNETIQAHRDGLIGNKGAVMDKALKFVSGGKQAVIVGDPRYSDRDAVMGYHWHLAFVGDEAACTKYVESMGDYDECQVKVIK